MTYYTIKEKTKEWEIKITAHNLASQYHALALDGITASGTEVYNMLDKSYYQIYFRKNRVFVIDSNYHEVSSFAVIQDQE